MPTTTSYCPSPESPSSWRSDIDRFIAEDVGPGDITAELLVPEGDGIAEIVCEDTAIAAGLEEAVEVFSRFGVRAVPQVADGDPVRKGRCVMMMEGPVRGIVTAERTALNIMMRMSGIATMTWNATAAVRAAGGTAVICGTRKTAPGLRALDKKAVALGGGEPHRMGLYDMVLIKDNHIAAAGGVGNAMSRLAGIPDGVKVEVEVESPEDAAEAARCHPDMIMFDNRSPEEAEDMYRIVKSIDPSISVEISGRVNMDNVASYAKCADRISMGCLTHSVRAIHYSLRLL